MWDKQTEPVVLRKNKKGDEVQIRKVEKRGSQYIDVRTWYLDPEDETRKPGKGITIPLAIAEEVADAIKALLREEL